MTGTVTVWSVTQTAVSDMVDKQQNIQYLLIYNFSTCATKQNTSNMKWKENEELVLQNRAEFFLEMEESGRTAHANKETARPAVPRTRACCGVMVTGPTVTGSTHCIPTELTHSVSV